MVEYRFQHRIHNYNVVVVEGDSVGGQAARRPCLRNIPGYSRGIEGVKYLSCVFPHAQPGMTIIRSQAIQLRCSGTHLICTLANGTDVISKAVILATGASFKGLSIPSLQGLPGVREECFDPVTEAAVLTGQEHVYVVGAGDSAIEVLLNTRVISGGGKGHLEKLILENSGTGESKPVPATDLFVLVGGQPQTAWLPAEIARDANGYVLTGNKIKRDSRRSPQPLERRILSVFIAGDGCRNGFAESVIRAIGEDSSAVVMVSEFLKLVKLDLCELSATMAWSFDQYKAGGKGPELLSCRQFKIEPVAPLLFPVLQNRWVLARELIFLAALETVMSLPALGAFQEFAAEGVNQWSVAALVGSLLRLLVFSSGKALAYVLKQPDHLHKTTRHWLVWWTVDGCGEDNPLPPTRFVIIAVSASTEPAQDDYLNQFGTATCELALKIMNYTFSTGENGAFAKADLLDQTKTVDDQVGKLLKNPPVENRDHTALLRSFVLASREASKSKGPFEIVVYFDGVENSNDMSMYDSTQLDVAAVATTLDRVQAKGLLPAPLSGVPIPFVLPSFPHGGSQVDPLKVEYFWRAWAERTEANLQPAAGDSEILKPNLSWSFVLQEAALIIGLISATLWCLGEDHRHYARYLQVIEETCTPAARGAGRNGEEQYGGRDRRRLPIPCVLTVPGTRRCRKQGAFTGRNTRTQPCVLAGAFLFDDRPCAFGGHSKHADQGGVNQGPAQLATRVPGGRAGRIHRGRRPGPYGLVKSKKGQIAHILSLDDKQHD